MKRFPAGLRLLLACCVVLAGESVFSQDADAPKDRVAAVAKQFDDAMQAFSKKYGEAKTDEERQKLFESSYPKVDEYLPKMLEIAKAHPEDSAAFDALVWVVQHDGGGQGPAKEALAQLARDHVENPRIGDVLPRLVYGPPRGVALVEAVLEKSPSASARAQACLTLAKRVKRDSELARRLAADPGMAEQIESFYGKEAAQKLRDSKPEDLEKRAEGLFERVVKEFSDLKGPEESIAKSAERELFEMRNLAVGKTAPEIEGEDIEGKTFKLSDYRGKVVLLDFWGDW